MYVPTLPFGSAFNVLARASLYGAVLLRGCPDETAFATLGASMGLTPFDYVGGAAPRRQGPGPRLGSPVCAKLRQ